MVEIFKIWKRTVVHVLVQKWWSFVQRIRKPTENHTESRTNLIFKICIVTKNLFTRHINIVIKQETNEDHPSQLWQESHEEPDPKYDATRKHVGYVSFRSLRLLNSPYNIISFSIDVMYFGEVYEGETYLGVELVPKKSKVDEVQPTYCSEFWDKEIEDRATFTIQHDSQSSIKIIWHPCFVSSKAKKVVVKVDVQNDEEKEKALMALSSVEGILSTSIDMEEKKLTVIGYNLTGEVFYELKKYWHTELVAIEYL
ncbi:hypothetical protein LXL04_017092 [Taraxacum kok-saghyz]